MVRVVHTAFPVSRACLDEVQSPDQSENNINDINVLEFYHLIRWNLSIGIGQSATHPDLPGLFAYRPALGLHPLVENLMCFLAHVVL